MTTTSTAPARPASGRPERRPNGLAALAGIACGGLTLAVADLVAGFVSDQSTPVVAVGRAAIDATPGPLKDFAVTTFGTHDKLVLLTGIALVVTVLSAVAGLVAARRPALGAGMAAVLGAVAALAAGTRPDAVPVDAVPALVGTLAGVAALAVLGRRLRALAATTTATATTATATAATTATLATATGRRTPRRSVLTGLAAVSGTAALAGTAGRLLATRSTGGLGPARVTLPAPAAPAPALPADVAVDVPGVTPFVTANRDFYRIDTALVVPRLDAARWRLRLHGLVDREVELSYADVLASALVERAVTLTCVSNEVGGTLAGTATWLGLPLAALLERAGVQPGADMVLSTSADGFTASTPLAALTDGRDAMVAVGMNGAALPAEHGFPARLVVPGLYGFVSATKWLVDLEVTRFDQAQAYWTRRGWSAQAPIRTASRIDVPKPFARVAPGPTPVAGVAWAQHRGIGRVEVRVDGGGWQPARLAGSAGADTWREWLWSWDAAPGQHTLEVRATDAAGAVQPQDRRPPKPDGATGWHSVVVQVG